MRDRASCKHFARSAVLAAVCGLQCFWFSFALLSFVEQQPAKTLDKTHLLEIFLVFWFHFSGHISMWNFLFFFFTGHSSNFSRCRQTCIDVSRHGKVEAVAAVNNNSERGETDSWHDVQRHGSHADRQYVTPPQTTHVALTAHWESASCLRQICFRKEIGSFDVAYAATGRTARMTRGSIFLWQRCADCGKNPVRYYFTIPSKDSLSGPWREDFISKYPRLVLRLDILLRWMTENKLLRCNTSWSSQITLFIHLNRLHIKEGFSG